MGNANPPRPVLHLLAAFSRHADLLAAAVGRAAEAWGPIAVAGEPFEFTETDYYERSMGPGLLKQLVAFEPLIDPAKLPEIKQTTDAWEREYADSACWPEARPVNLDPGYVTEAKLVLASTKDRDHRIYLDRGVYAEVTLYYHAKAWRSRPWTYPDYQRPDVEEFLTRCREHLRQRYRTAGP